MLKKLQLSLMKLKLLYFFSGALIVLFPFLNIFFKVFRGVSISFIHFFERHASFDFRIPFLFQKYIHFYLTEFWIIGLVISAFLLKEVRLKNFFFNCHSRYLTIYIGVALISITLSIFSTYFTQYVYVLNLLIAFMAFHLIFLIFQQRIDLIQPIFWAFFGITVIESLIGIGQFVYQQSLGLTFLAEPEITSYMKDFPAFPMDETNRTFFNLLPWISPNQSCVLRAFGTFEHPNIFGAYLTIALFVAYYLFISTQKKSGRVLLCITIPLIILALGLTFSRGAIFAWMAGTLLFYGIGWVKRSSFSPDEKKGLTLLFILISLGGLAALGLLFNHLVARGGFLNVNTISSNSDQGRIVLFQLAFLMFKSFPILGVGFNGYSLFPYGSLNSDFEGLNEMGTYSHNIYLQIASETGIVGSIFVGLFLFSIFKIIRKNKLTPLKLTLGSILFTFLLSGLVDHFLWTHNSGRMMFFLFTALFAAALTPPKEKIAVLDHPTST